MAKTRTGFQQAFSALASGDYRRFALSHLLTQLGAQLLQTAVLWHIFELTGSALLLGLSGLARAGPHIVLSLAGGVFADRLNRVRLIQAGQTANALLVLALAALTFTGSVEVWHLYLVTFLNSAFTAVTQPARTALIPSLVGRSSLVNAMALNSTIGQSSQILGPALAGVAIAYAGLDLVYLCNGLFYLSGMIAMVAIRVAAPLAETLESPWRSLVAGLKFVRSRPVITSLLVLDMGETVLASYRALLPVLADRLGMGVTGYGLLSAAPSAGSLLGAGLIIALGDMKYKGMYTVFGVLAYCAALVVLAASQWFALCLVAAALLGATNSIQAIPRNTAILAISPEGLRGRVEAFRSTLAGGGPPVGYILSGGLATLLGAPGALFVGAISCAVLVTGVAIARPELRDPYLGSTPPTAPPQ